MLKIANAQFWVHDQDEALKFYTKTLGWEVRAFDASQYQTHQAPIVEAVYASR